MKKKFQFKEGSTATVPEGVCFEEIPGQFFGDGDPLDGFSLGILLDRGQLEFAMTPERAESQGAISAWCEVVPQPSDQIEVISVDLGAASGESDDCHQGGSPPSCRIKILESEGSSS